MTTEPLARSALEQAALVRSGEVSARALVEAALAAIERDDPTLNAFVALCADRALAEADGVAPGDNRPLAGVPIAIKDLFALTEGLPTTNGSRSLGDWVPDHDSPVVARLRAAGAIVIGKTNTPEFGMRPVTEPERFGATRNPWDPSMTPGGSSGGSGAAVAAGMVALAHGNDAGGSLRIPASCCGLVGLKPTRLRIPLGAALAEFAGFGTDGVLTRTVRDTAVALDVLSGDEPDAPLLGPPPPPVPFAEAARQPPGRLTIRVCEVPPADVELDPVCREGVRVAAALLERLGHDVEPWTPDWTDPDFDAHWATAGGAMLQSMFHRFGALRGSPLDPDEMEPPARQVATRTPITAAEFHEASGWLQRFTRRVIGSWPPGAVLLTPSLCRTIGPVGAIPPGEGVRFSAFLRTFNVTGQPAISLPLHRDERGLPVGVQLAGPLGAEARLLSLAAQIEQEAPWPRPGSTDSRGASPP